MYRGSVRRALFTLSLLAICSPLHAAEPLRFVVRFASSVRALPFTGRVLVLLTPGSSGEPRRGPAWFNTAPFFARDVRDWKPDTDMVIDASAAGYPAPLDRIDPGTYRAQAVLDLHPDTHRIGDAPGNLYSNAITAELDPAKGGAFALQVDRQIPAVPFPETERIKLVEIPSPLLSRFRGHPVRLRAGVVLPPDYAQKPQRRYPVLYVIPGFGGDHFMATYLLRSPFAGSELGALVAVLDPDADTGHHVFADSANNGPCGKALLTELIPAIERRFRAVGRPEARFLTGHSSGGWSSLWLQVAYPDFFGGVWSTAPDPVDFRDFQRIDLYAPGQNMYRDRDGKERPLARQGGRELLYYRPFCLMESVLGRGGQIGSFEAVFSPRGADGRPEPLFDRATGAVNPTVAKAWEKYDIRLVLERNWPVLGKKLRGKLHIFTGEEDTFYLEGAVRLLQASLKQHNSDAVVEIHPGKDHGTLVNRELLDRIAREIRAAFLRNNPAAAQAPARDQAALWRERSNRRLPPAGPGEPAR